MYGIILLSGSAYTLNPLPPLKGIEYWGLLFFSCLVFIGYLMVIFHPETSAGKVYSIYPFIWCFLSGLGVLQNINGTIPKTKKSFQNGTKNY